MKDDFKSLQFVPFEDVLKSGPYHAHFHLPNPGVTMTWILKIVLLLLKPILAIVTPILLAELKKALLSFYEHAAETENPWDDFLAEFLLKILGIPTPE